MHPDGRLIIRTAVRSFSRPDGRIAPIGILSLPIYGSDLEDSPEWLFVSVLFSTKEELTGVPGTPYLTAWANSGKSGREQALRLMAIRVRFVASSRPVMR